MKKYIKDVAAILLFEFIWFFGCVAICIMAVGAAIYIQTGSATISLPMWTPLAGVPLSVLTQWMLYKFATN